MEDNANGSLVPYLRLKLHMGSYAGSSALLSVRDQLLAAHSRQPGQLFLTPAGSFTLTLSPHVLLSSHARAAFAGGMLTARLQVIPYWTWRLLLSGHERGLLTSDTR